jgi:alkylation response protein AidB-like acyl-CoA dehydrogenase
MRLSDAQMREEALRAYLHDTARQWRPGAGPAYAARALRTKTYVTQEATRLCADLFALSGGRHYTRDGRLARTLAASFAGTALRPPLALALDTLLQQFSAE